MNRPVVIAVIAFWLVMMGLLVYRQAATQLPTGAMDALTTRESYLILELPSGQRAGSVQMLQQPSRRDDEQGLQMTVIARGALNLLGRMTEFTLRGDTWRSVESGRTIFAWRLNSEGHRIAFEGRIEDGRLVAEVRTAGEQIPVEFSVGDSFSLSPDFTADLDVNQMTVGGTYTTESFDPLAMSKSTMRIRVLREERIEAYGMEYDTKVLEIDTGMMRTLVWISGDNELVRMQTPVGFNLVKADSQTAMGAIQPGQADDLLGFTAIQPTGLRPFRGALRMVARISGLDEALSLPEDDAQRFVEDGLLEIAPVWPGEAASALSGTDEISSGEEYLLGDAFVQVDHPTIQEQAAAIIGDADTAWEKARLVYDFVFHELEKEAVISFPSALEVLESRAGDCNEHTVLFAALARAAGVPTRIAIGVVWSDELDGFYYHAWPEVLIDGIWIWLDPTLGQIPADATHIKLFTGGIETWPRLTAFIGNLAIEVVDIE